jgi:hypothetical protein
MLALIIIGWIVGGILAWLATGTALAKLCAPKFWAKANMKYGDGTGGGYYNHERPARIRKSVREQSEVMVIFWPVAFVVLMVSRLLDDSINKHDPAEIERRDKQQKTRIAELEKELGINPPKNYGTELDGDDAALARTIAEMKKGRDPLLRDYESDIDDEPRRLRSYRDVNSSYESSKRWLGDV